MSHGNAPKDESQREPQLAPEGAPRRELPRAALLGPCEAAAADLVVALAALEVPRLDGEGVSASVGLVRSVQSALDAAVVRIGMQADHLAARGLSASARDACLGSGQVRGSTARREAKRAGLAARRMDLGQAMGSGRLGPDHLDALVRRLDRLDDETLTDVAIDHLLADGHVLPADTFDAALRRAVDAAVAAPAEPDSDAPTAAEAAAEAARAASEVRHWFDHRTGLGHLHATLDPERYEALVEALDHHTATLAHRAEGDGGSVTKGSNLAAAALVDLVCSSGARATHLPHVTVVVDQRTLAAGRHQATVAETGSGHGLTDEAVARLCCDATLQRVTFDERGLPIDVGRRYRTATDAQWAALRAMYSACAWVGCDAPLHHCQAHHLRPWGRGGATNLDNLVPLCSHHHHQVHEGRWRLALQDDRSLTLTRPDGGIHARMAGPPMRRSMPPLGNP